MKITDFTVYYINLDKDIERKQILEDNLNKLGLDYQRISAVYGKNLFNERYLNQIAKKFDVDRDLIKPDFWFNRSNFKTMANNPKHVLSKVGCYLSHLLAIRTALINKVDRLLVLEDDAFPLLNAMDSFTIPEDTDIYYLGGGFFHQVKPKRVTTDTILIDTDKVKVCCTYAYIIPNRQKMLDIYNTLMSVFNDGKSHDYSDDFRNGHTKLRAQAIDFMYINYYQKYGKCYIANPVKFTHQELGSNIVQNRERYKLKFFYNKSHERLLSI